MDKISFTKKEAIEALDRIDSLIDMLDWQGILDPEDLNDVEKDMAIVSTFLNCVKE